MPNRAAIIITEGRYVTGLTLRNGDDSWNDELENLWLETDPQLLADLRYLVELGEVFTDSEAAAARVRAAIGDGHE